MTWGDRVRVTCGTAVFQNVQVGDWAIHIDANLVAANLGAWRVSYVDPAFFYYEFERTTATVQLGVTLNAGGIVFVRTAAQLQKVTVPAASNYTAATFVDEINADITGAKAEVYRTNRIRVRTNTFAEGGDIALVAQNAQGVKLGMNPAGAIANLTSHLPSVESGTPEDGTPWFGWTTVATVTTPQTVFNPTSDLFFQQSFVKGLRNLPDADSGLPRSRYGTNTRYQSPIVINEGTSAITVRVPALDEFVVADRIYPASCWALGPIDDLTVLIDGDIEQKRYVIPMFRRLKPTSNVYGGTNTFTDADNGNQSLAVGFGTGFDFKDFIVYMKSRIKTHSEAGDTNKSILWRYFRYGVDGNAAKLRYVYPTAPDLPVSVVGDSAPASNQGTLRINVALPSSSARTGQTIRATTRMGVIATNVGSLKVQTYILGYLIGSAVRNVQLNYTARGVTAFSGVVTGGTSGATGTVVSDSLPGGGGGAGTLILSGVTGTFTNGETITGGGGSATSSGGQVGLTTLTLTVALPGATDHGFNVSDQIWTQSNNANFSTGLHTITARTTTTVTYQENTNSIGATVNIGTVSFDSSGEATLTGSTIVVNDIVNVGSQVTSLPIDYQQALRIGVIGAQYWTALADSAAVATTVPTWYPIRDPATIKFYPLNSGASTASAIATAVNALAALPNTVCPVTAVAVGLAGDTSGVISKASFDDFATTNYSYTLKDGLNWVSSHTTPPDTSTNFSFTFKGGVTAALATNADWANEEVHLVPMSAKNMVDYLSTLAVSGLASAADVTRSDEAHHVQISSKTLGADGSVQVQGGMANSLSASVIGSSTNLSSTYSMVTVKKADVDGLAGSMWVEVQNSIPLPKETFTSGTGCSSIDTSGNFTLTGTQAWTYANTGAAQLNSSTWQIEKHGKFTAFVWDGISTSPDLSGIQEGDWVIISKGAKTISSRNCGQFRVVRVNNTLKTFWIENTNMAEEMVTAQLWFLTYDSIMPGDTLSIGVDVWGAGNQGLWTVESINSGSVQQFKVSVTAKATTLFAGPGTLGISAALVQTIEGEPTKLVKQVNTVSLNPVDGSLVDVKFSTFQGYKKIGSGAGSTLIGLDKMAFPATLAEGIDGYSHSIGLIAEANRILYGVDDDPSTYPGIVSSGSNVNQSGPLVRRITIALAIRTRATGVVVEEVKSRVRSAVASVVNRTKTSKAISIADIIGAVKSVNGVDGVVIISPQYGVGHDLIPVQPYEKPLILNLDQDVQVSLVGD
jgi:hypothetical protein